MSKHREFWNKEYKTSAHFALSEAAAGDLEKFCRWIERNHGKRLLNVTTQVLDLGSGNGRNLIYLAQNYGMRGIGYDISTEGVKLAQKNSENLPIKYVARSIEGPLDIPDQSVSLVLDMMTSHFLKAKDREVLRDEILRVLKPGGWFFFKSFLADEDLHVKRLLKEHAAGEEHAYIHPRSGLYEYTWTEQAMYDFFSPYFTIQKIERSHKHIRDGKANKRRSIVVYLQKPL